MDRPQPSREQAHAVVVHLRGTDDTPPAPVDWLAVARLTGGLAASEACPRPGSAPLLPFRARAALEVRRAIVSGERPCVRNGPTSFETLGAAYFILTAGQYTQECPNHTSPHGRHRWRFTGSRSQGDRTQTCDYCGAQRAPA